MLATGRFDACRPEYWDQQAQDFEKNLVSLSPLTREQLRLLRFPRDYTLLDIGAGSGRLTIPLAKRMKAVTALEPSREMLSILRAKADKEGLKNITFIERSWDDVTAATIPPHDIVVSSLSLFMADLKSSFLMMDLASRCGVYIFASASNWMDDRLQEALFGRRLPVLPDHLYVYNILNEVNIPANLNIIEYDHTVSYSGIEEAVSAFSRGYRIPKKMEPALREYLRGVLVEEDGRLCLRQRKKVAMIWWKKRKD